MILFYCDETGLEPNQGPFFIFGGLAVPAGRARALKGAFADLLSKYGYDPVKDPADPRPLKFNGRTPEDVDHQTLKTIKQESLALAADAGCTLYVTAILHDILRKEEKRHWPLNQLLRCVEASLEKEREDAMVVIDHYEKGETKTLRSIMQERFLRGLSFPGGPFPLTNIVGMAEGCIGSSHFASILDVALGCIRLAVERREKDERLARTLLQQVSPLFPRDKHGKILARHLSFLPGAVYPPMLPEYRRLAAFLEACGLPPARLPDPKE